MPRFLDHHGCTPELGEGAFAAPGTTLIGDVSLGASASVWFGSVLRGDVMPIVIGPRTNVQDLSLAHGVSGRFGVELGAEVTVGHRVVIHGCTVADRVLVGMGSVLLDGSTVGEGAIVAAGAVVPPGMEVPPRSLVAGVPAKVRRDVTDAEYDDIVASAERYCRLAESYRTGG